MSHSLPVSGNFVVEIGHFKGSSIDQLGRPNLLDARCDNLNHHPEDCLMTSPACASRTTSRNSPARRFATAVVLGGIVFAALWSMVFGMATSMLIGAGCCVVIVVASSASDVAGMMLDAVASVASGVLAVIATILAALLSVLEF